MVNKRGFVLVGLIVLLCGTVATRAEHDPQEFVYIIEVEGTIDAGIADFVKGSITKAERDGAEALIIELDTPGGLISATEDIVDIIREDRIKVATYVTPEKAWAYSAGTFILLSSNVAAMDNHTVLGAARPIPADEKMIEAMATWMRAIAEQRDRPADVAENFVRYNLSLTAENAYELGVIDLIADNLDELLDNMGLGGAEKRQIEMGIFSKFLRILSHPDIVVILFIAGMLGIIFEITTPGIGVPGVAGVICMLLALWGLGILEINYAGLALIVLGAVLLATEIFVPGFGVFGVGGVVALVLGLMMVDKEPWVVIAGDVAKGIVLGLLAVFAVFIVLARRAMKRPAVIGREELIGKPGVAATDLAPKGLVKIKGELWSAASEERIRKGERVIIKDVKGVTLIAKRLPEKKPR